MSERTPDLDAILDDAWSTVVGGMDWLKSVLLGEFADHQSLSTIIAQMLVNFMPGVVIVTSARDAVAVILRLAAHPEKREELMEWVVLSACLIVIALPIAMAAGGAVVAGVGAVVGGIAGSELGAALRGLMLMLIRQSAPLVDVVRFLQKFIKGDILKFLRAVDFVKYEKALLLVVKKFIGKLIEMVRSLRLHLESLRYFDTVKSTILKLAEWERRFYAVQEDALKQLPKALVELQARLANALAQTVPIEMHMVPAGVPAGKVPAATPATQRVRDTPGRILARVEDTTPAAGSTSTKDMAAAPSPKSNATSTVHPNEPPALPLRDTPEPLEPHDVGANTRTQAAAEPTNGESAAAGATRVSRVKINNFDEYRDISSNPLQPNTVYEYNGAEFETDSLGRSISTRGTVDTSNKGQRLPSVDHAIGNQADALPTDVGFHRGADSLGFPGGHLNVNPGNGAPMPTEFPGVPNLNGGAYKQLENSLRKLHNEGNSVYSNFEAIFNDGNLTQRPDSFRVTYSVNGGMPRVRTFVNQPGG